MRCARTARRWTMGLCLLLALGAVPACLQAQQTPPAPPTSVVVEREHHMSEAEAQELFRSVDEILKFASEHSGLPIQHPVKKKLATREEVAKYVEKRMKEQQGNERFDVQARTLMKLGLLPPGFNLRQYMLDLYKEQVEGWYDAKSKTVFLLDWVSADLQKPVMAHELVHALQDQNFDLEHWLNVASDSRDATDQMVIDEQRAARQSIIEGQAMVVLYDYQLTSTGETIESAPTLVQMMRGSITEDPDSVYAKAPIYLREALLFPYTYGTDFVVHLLAKRGKQAAFAGVLQRPPLDTHQIMEPAMYLSGEPQVQVKVVALEQVAGGKWRQQDFSGLGEVDLRVILLQWSGKEAAARLAPAWRGGYYMALADHKHKEAPLALAMVVNFTNPDAASEFAKIYEAELPKRYFDLRAGKAPRQWQSEDGPIELLVQGSSVIALESLPVAEMGRARQALQDAVREPVEVRPAP